MAAISKYILVIAVIGLAVVFLNISSDANDVVPFKSHNLNDSNSPKNQRFHKLAPSKGQGSDLPSKKPVTIYDGPLAGDELCGENIIVHMGDMKFSIPDRKGMSIQFLDGKSIHLCRDQYEREIRGARSILWPGFRVIDKRKDKNQFDTEYASEIKFLKQGQSNFEEIILENGIKKIVLLPRKSEIFILSPETAPTSDKEPVAITCDPKPQPNSNPGLSFCNTSYVHPSGLWLVYSFDRGTQPDEGMLDADKARRNWLEEMLKN